MSPHPMLKNLCKWTLIVLVLTACSVQPTPVSILPSPTTQVAALPTAIPITVTKSAVEWKTTLVKAFQVQGERSYRSETDTKIESESGSHTVVEFMPPDRYHIVSQPASELIIIGPQVYNKQGNQWVELQVPADSIVTPLAQAEKNMTDVQCISPEMLDGKALHLCQYTLRSKIGDTDTTSQIKLWIDADTNLPYKMVMNGAVGGMDSQTGKIKAVKATSSTIYTYDPSIQINQPAVEK